ncbi:MAG: hypothetical protein JW829_20125, partial [Pirellulales bacterium]|nr:hypothetical protein [Pirellulales bacterium]
SGNKTDLLSGNKAAFLSGNRISLFSNINIKIEISDSGNHNGNHGVPAAMAARFQALDQNQDGQVSIDEYSASKAQRKMQQVKKRFRRLDRDKNQKLTIQEFGQPDR